MASQNSSKTKKPREKHTNCESHIILTVKNVDMKQSSDALLADFPAEIFMKISHNHLIDAVEAVKHRRPSPQVRETFKKMFAAGHSPSSAHAAHTFLILQEHEKDFFEILGDASKCPRLKWCYNFYYATFEESYGTPSGEKMLDSLRDFVDDYNDRCKSECASVTMSNSEDLIIAVCSPLMRRVLTLSPSSSKIIFVDSTGTVDKMNSRVFFFLAPTVAGALPIGVIISSSESEEAITCGLNALHSLFPSGAFYGRGDLGPSIFMTDDCFALRNSLHNVYPLAILLLCIFHVLAAFWRYVWDSDHGVVSTDRQNVYYLLKELLLCKDVDLFEIMFENVLKNELTLKYRYVEKRLKQLKERSKEWALCHRKGLMTLRNNTNNYSEGCMRTFKDIVMQRVKAFNVVQLLDFITTKLGSYYESRITAVLNDTMSNYRKSKYFIPEEKLDGLELVFQLSETEYLVKNSAKKIQHLVNTELEFCSCFQGESGGPCKHQFFICKKFGLSSNSFLPFADKEAKMRLHLILTGSLEGVKSTWYDKLALDATVTSTPPPEIGLTEPEQHIEVISNDLNEEPTPPPTLCCVDPPASCSESLPENSVEDAQVKIKQFSDILLRNVESRPEIFLPAVAKMWKSIMAHKSSESWLQSAMHNFGAGSGPLPLKNKKRQLPSLQASETQASSQNQQPRMITGHGKVINVQKTAVGRRSGKNICALSAGRNLAVEQNASQEHQPRTFVTKRHGKQIPVQSTGIARRSVYLGGRNLQQTGRPPKGISNVVRSAPKPWAVPPKASQKAPHQLNKCVSDNRTLGKTHHKK